MSFRIVSSKLTGSPGESGWAQVHEFKPEDKKKLKLRGHLFAVLSTKTQKAGVESVIAGRELISRLHEEYFGSVSTSAFNALQEAVEKVINEFAQNWGDVQIAAVAVCDKVVYSAAGGKAQVSIFRDGMLAKILESKKEINEDNKANIISASGYPQENDILVLATTPFFEVFSDGALKAALSGRDLGSAVESLAPQAHTGEDKGSLGAVFIKFTKSDSQEKVAELGKNLEKLPAISKELKGKGTSIVDSLKNRFFSKLSYRLPEKKIYVRKQEEELSSSQNRKVAVSIGSILLALLVVSIFFGVRQKRISDEKGRYESRLNQAIHQLEESISLLNLDAQRSRELFQESSQIADQLVIEEVEDERLETLKQDLNQNRGTILGEYRKDPELYIDLSLLSDGFSGDDMASSEETLHIIDLDSEKAIEISINTKKSKVIGGPNEIDNPKFIASYLDNAYYLNPDGIFEIGEEDATIETDWSGDANLYAYAGNLYVLDKGSSDVWRYSAAEVGFGSKGSWLSESAEPNLSRIISWTIDGSIWMLSETGKVFKFSLGNQQNFTIKGVFPPLIGPRAIYTNEGQESLYILDPNESRILVISKEGDYLAQYYSEIINNTSDFAVSEGNGLVILLVSEKLYSISLEHLEKL